MHCFSSSGLHHTQPWILVQVHLCTDLRDIIPPVHPHKYTLPFVLFGSFLLTFSFSFWLVLELLLPNLKEHMKQLMSMEVAVDLQFPMSEYLTIQAQEVYQSQSPIPTFREQNSQFPLIVKSLEACLDLVWFRDRCRTLHFLWGRCPFQGFFVRALLGVWQEIRVVWHFRLSFLPLRIGMHFLVVGEGVFSYLKVQDLSFHSWLLKVSISQLKHYYNSPHHHSFLPSSLSLIFS